MTIKINLIPAVVIGIVLPIILFLTGDVSIIFCICIFLLVNILSIFFSVHYMGLYYLLQPYNKDLKMKSIGYSIASMITYSITYLLTYFSVNVLVFVLIFILFTIIYILIILKLVKDKSCYTFRLK